MKELKDYQDRDGVIGHYDTRLGCLEFGDAWQRIGAAAFADAQFVPIAESHAFNSTVCIEPIRYRPSTNPDCRWYELPGCMSADNLIAMVIGLPGHSITQQLYSKLKANRWFCWNTYKIWSTPEGKRDESMKNLTPDFAGPSMLIAFFRSLDVHLWSLLFLDFYLIGAVLLRSFLRWYDENDVGDDLNLSLLICQSFVLFPTPASKIATKLYFKFGGGQDCWDRYFKSDDAPPMNEIMRSTLEHHQT